MSRTVTAFYDTRAEAEAARDRLSSEVDVEGRAKIIDKNSVSGDEGSSDFHSVPLSNEDRHAYGEGLNRGGFMLCAEVDGDEDADKIVSILEQTSSVDLDDRQSSWRNEGWQPGATATQTGDFGASRETSGRSDRDGRTVEEERIPIVDEQLQVGKREVERGGARVRSYVREEPVSEQVNLRDESISVERRPVNEQISSADLNRGDMLQDREIEMHAKGEEAVIGKDARVKEELVVRKTAGEHTENVQDTVRHTEVEVDEDGRSGR